MTTTVTEELAFADAFHRLASMPGYRGAIIIVNTSAHGDERAVVKSTLPGHMAAKLIQAVAEESTRPDARRIVLPS